MLVDAVEHYNEPEVRLCALPLPALETPSPYADRFVIRIPQLPGKHTRETLQGFAGDQALGPSPGNNDRDGLIGEVQPPLGDKPCLADPLTPQNRNHR